MALQKSVGLVQALGIPGQEVVKGQAVYLAYNPLSDGSVAAGAFAFKAAATGDGEAFAYASAKGGEGDAPLGLVERVTDASIPNVQDAYTGVYPAGFAVTVAIRGQFYAAAPSAVASDGLSVFINPATGAVNIAASAGEGEVGTGWICRIPNGGASAGAGDTVIFERF